MGILKNIYRVLSGKQTNHIYQDDGGTWGIATSKSVKLKRIPYNTSFLLVYDSLFKENYDYVVTGNLTVDGVGLSVEAMANQRMVQWQTGTNRLVGYSKITASNGQPACCGWSGVLRAEDSGDRVLQLEYFGYSSSGRELHATVTKKCPESLSKNLGQVDYKDIVKEMNDAYAIATSIRIS